MTMLKVFVLAVLLGAASAQENCEAIGGTCLDYRNYICHAGYEQGLCPGDTYQRCCLECDAECDAEDAAFDDSACESQGGDCFDNTNYCGSGNIYDTDTSVCGNNDSDGLSRECCRPFVESTDCPRIVTREEWGARPPNGVSYMSDGVPYLFIHHSAGADCYTYDDCVAEVQGIQDYHMDGNGWSDIGYSFLIGGDGNVYEGRGWNVVGAHTYGFNSVGYGIDFIGTFTSKDPEEVAQTAYFNLANCAAGLGKVPSSYELYGHRQTTSTECPGDQFYNTIKTRPYPHYASGCLSPDCYNP